MSTGEDNPAMAGLAQAAIEAGVVTDYTNGAVTEEDEYESDAEVDAAPGSVLSVLRERAAHLRDEQTTDLDVPGYGGLLVGRFRAVSLGRIYAKASGTQTPLNPDIQMATHTLSGALEQLFMKDAPESEELHPLFTDIIARLDDDLVDALNLHPEARTAAAVLVALCGGGPLGETRAWALYMQYQGWLLAGVDDENAEQAVVSQAVGESLPT